MNASERCRLRSRLLGGSDKDNGRRTTMRGGHATMTHAYRAGSGRHGHATGWPGRHPAGTLLARCAGACCDTCGTRRDRGPWAGQGPGRCVVWGSLPSSSSSLSQARLTLVSRALASCGSPSITPIHPLLVSAGISSPSSSSPELKASPPSLCQPLPTTSPSTHILCPRASHHHHEGGYLSPPPGRFDCARPPGPACPRWRTGPRV